jgi:hypothetical protein
MAAADKANEARLALEKAKKDAESRAGKTTAERLAEMKAEREKKLAEQAAARQEAKKNTPSKQEQADLDRNKKRIQQILADNPDTGAGGIIGSSVTKWSIDPKTGKKRTPKEIVDAVTEAVLADKSSGGISIDPLTGKQRPLTPAQKVNQALGQLMQNAMYEGEGLSEAYDVYKYLQKGSRKGTVEYLANKPENWEINKDSVGKILDRKYFDEPGNRKVFIVDPTKNQLTPEEIKAYQDAGAMLLDPVTGFQVMIDKQGRYTLGDQPNDANIEDYSKYVAPVQPLNYFLNKPGGKSGGFRNAPSNTSVGGSSNTSFNTSGNTSNLNFAPESFSLGADTGGDPDSLTAGDGRQFDNFSDYLIYQNNLDSKMEDRKSAYDLLFQEFDRYGLGSLVEPLKGLIQENVSPSEFTLRLRETEAYKKRFAANAQRIAKGLRALSEAEYIGTEDQYQDVMRRYGLPESYYKRGDLGIQQGFEKFLGGDVSAVELEDRIQTAQNRVVNSNPEVAKALKEFYPGISNGDILAYVLDPSNAIENIKRKVTAAEIGGAAMQSGLQTGVTRAEELGNAGINKQQAQQGFGTIAGGLQRGSQLASIYGENPYTQTTAETEVFGLSGKTEAEKQRKKITSLEKATFGGQTGITSGALTRDRAGNY